MLFRKIAGTGKCWNWLIISLGIVWRMAAQAEVVDRIVAILNDDLILLSEVHEQAALPVARALATLDDDAAAEDEMLRYLVERRLLADEVRYLAVPRESDITRDLARRYIIETVYAGDAAAFEERLQRAGVSQSALDQELVLYQKGLDYIRRKNRFREDVDDADRVLTLFSNWLKALKQEAELHILR